MGKDKAKRSFKTAKLFWWYNMYSSADFSITPRPLYGSDGNKVFDVHSQPMNLREEVKELGEFPSLSGDRWPGSLPRNGSGFCPMDRRTLSSRSFPYLSSAFGLRPSTLWSGRFESCQSTGEIDQVMEI